MLREGTILTIYLDPKTEVAPEGRARIVRYIGSGYDAVMMGRYEVEFIDEPGATYERQIKDGEQ